jgi:hypothetical protein
MPQGPQQDLLGVSNSLELWTHHEQVPPLLHSNTSISPVTTIITYIAQPSFITWCRGGGWHWKPCPSLSLCWWPKNNNSSVILWHIVGLNVCLFHWW